MTDTSRLAALKLATLHPSDRQWIINNLDSDQRQQIKFLLDEIAALNIDNIDAIYQELANTASRQKKVSEPSKKGTLSPLLLQWSQLSSHEVVSRLECLPEALRLCVIGCNHWPWLEEIINRYQLSEVVIKENISPVPSIIELLLHECETHLQ